MTTPIDMTGFRETIDAGRPHEVVGALRAHIDEFPSNYQVLSLAYMALSAALLDGSEDWPARDPMLRQDWRAVVRALVRQDDGSERPRVLHHGLASLLTSSNIEAARKLVAGIVPEIEPEGQQSTGVALFFAVARSVLPEGAPSQSEISRMHLAHFPNFQRHDLSLPYSVKFNEAQYGANRDDLLEHFRTPSDALASEPGLGLQHILLLDQLRRQPWLVKNADEFGGLRDIVASRTRHIGVDGQEEAERAAARALMLKYADRERSVGTELMKQLGLTETNFAEVPRYRGPKEPPPKPMGALDKVVWGGINKVKMTFPALIPRGRRPRVALCVSGQLRGYKRAFPTWRQALLPFADFDIFVHSWANVGQASPNPARAFLPFEGQQFCAAWRQVGTLLSFDDMKARYPSLFSSLESSAQIDGETLKRYYGAREVVVEDERDERFSNFSNQDKMHYKIHAAHELAMTCGDRYDLVLRLRPDLEMHLPAFSWSRLNRDCNRSGVLYADGGFGVHYFSLVIGDQMAIGSPNVMTIYAETWKNYKALASLGVAGMQKELAGHASLAQICWLAGLDVQALPFRRGALLDMEVLQKSSILAALETDAAGRNDMYDKQLLSAAGND